MANVYLKITDLHDNENGFSGRKNYNAESDVVWNHIFSTVSKYKEQGHKVFIQFLGDIFHNSYKEAVTAIRGNNRIYSLRLMVDGMFSVVGNHETQYYKNNPFWTLFTTMESKRMRRLDRKLWQPQGNVDIISVPDEVVDGDVRFIFNHYDCPIVVPPSDGKMNIGLFHRDLYSKDIAAHMRDNVGLQVFEHTPVYFDTGNSTVLNGYDYAYFGHMHMMYGKWNYKCELTGYETVLHYLSTLGRTNHLEVKDTFLERDIPATFVEDGKFLKVESNKFHLLSREESVFEELIVKQQEARQIVKERKAFAEHVMVSDDPIENIRKTLVGMPAMLNIFEELLASGSTQYDHGFMREIEEVRKL